MFRINTNVTSIQSRRILGHTSKDLSNRTERLSSGLRINHANDDAAGLAASEGMRAQITGAKQANQNLSQVTAMLQTADSGLEQIGAMLNRLKQLAIQAADASYNPNNRNAMSLEASALMAEISRIAQTTSYNGMTLISSAGVGTGAVFTFYVGTGDHTISSSVQTLTLEVSGVTFSAAGLGSINGVAANLTLADFLVAGDAVALVSAADTAINRLTELRTRIGSFMSRLDKAQSNIRGIDEATQNSESIIRNADFAEESAALTRAQILVQAGTSLLNQADALPQNSLELLS